MIPTPTRTRSGLRERLLGPSKNSGSGTRLVGEISNERAGYLHFHGLFAFAYLWSGIFDSNFISTGNHRAVAKRSDAVLPGMARSYSTPVRRISRSFSSDVKLARPGCEFCRMSGTRKVQHWHAKVGWARRIFVRAVIPQRVEKPIDARCADD